MREQIAIADLHALSRGIAWSRDYTINTGGYFELEHDSSETHRSEFSGVLLRQGLRSMVIDSFGDIGECGGINGGDCFGVFN
mmetsp:Transcript_39011/g.57399  ORF Transcript_39011/g.57399 Transcript_39011/m.57399 type:complete len:82 (+) Transcript_39011:166-411(+)